MEFGGMYAGIVFLAMIVYGVVHSLLASLSAKTFARRIGDSSARRYYRMAYNLFAVISLLPVLVLIRSLPDHTLYQIPFPWSILTLSLQALAGLLLLLGLLETGPLTFLGIRQIFNPQKEEGPLVLTGPYRYIRHPLYSSGLLIIWLIPIMTVNLLAFNLAASIYLILGARIEERKLNRQYGEEYLLYKQATPMLFPLPQFRPNKSRRMSADQGNLTKR
jgi:protein-S-isoprenylcysteine O-methyltransferase Ste14